MGPNPIRGKDDGYCWYILVNNFVVRRTMINNIFNKNPILELV